MNWDSSVYVAVGNKTYGPMVLRAFKQHLDQGHIPTEALVCRSHQEGWLELNTALDLIGASFPDFWRHRVTPPPIPIEASGPPPLPLTPVASHDYELDEGEEEEGDDDIDYHEHQSNYCCPECGSENITRAAIIYQQGTSTSYQEPAYEYFDTMSQSFRSVGGGSTTHSTDLAQQFSPPEGVPCGCLWFLFLVGGFGGLFLGGVPGAVILGVITSVGIAFLHYIFIRLPEQREYERTWYCFRCGNKFLK